MHRDLLSGHATGDSVNLDVVAGDWGSIGLWHCPPHQKAGVGAGHLQNDTTS